MPELKEVIALRALADEYEAGSGFEDEFPILREAADTIEALQRQLAEVKGDYERVMELLAKQHIAYSKMAVELSAREADVVALRDALDGVRYGILCPVSGIPGTECLLPDITKALADTAPTASAIRRKWRDEALEEAAKVCDVESAYRHQNANQAEQGDSEWGEPDEAVRIQGTKGVTANLLAVKIRTLKNG